MANDQINIVYGAVQEISMKVTSFVTSMNNHLGDVDGVFTNLLNHGWRGQGANAFQECSRQWHSKADQMADTLSNLARKVDDTQVNFNAADAAAARSISM
jgi:WXG100 family type VII secretion target